MLFGKHINRYYLRYGWLLLLGVAALVMVDTNMLKMPELYRMVVNGLNSGAGTLADGSAVPFDMDFLLEEICRPMLFIMVFMASGRFLWRVCFFGSAIAVETDLRGRMFDRCKDLSRQFYEREKVGSLMSLFTNDLETVHECFGSGILMLADATLLGIMAFYKMLRMHGLLTLFSLVPMILLFAMGAVVGKSMRRKWQLRQEAFSDLSDFSQESFSGIAVIKAFVKESKELLAFRRLNRQNEDANVNYTRISTLFQIFVTLFVESIICVILGYGGFLVHEGVFNAGQLVEFIGYFTSIVWPVMAVSQLIEMKSRGRASLDRIGALLDTRADVTDAPDVEDVAPLSGTIEFRHLTFRYPGADCNALSNVSLTIEAGENVGIIGKTGSGKTTLVDLILRTYNVPDGTLFLDGHDVNRIPIRTVRRDAAYVPQDNFLFSDTIGNNIAFAEDDSSAPDRIEAAARLADVHDNIDEFPDKYETVLGERGVTVSGGQKQRISIARALMKDAPILILDDAVSAVDTGTEKTILKNLRETRRGKTTILIAHRVSTVEGMDKVVYLEDGRVAAVGTHDELCETCPAYRNMVELQQLQSLSEEKEAGK
ncbi:MAG: ABC transporter ATP-binding protein/permease [Clostridiales bacterium]|nr:ABC transporter ATP-binding protein/permease [Clostridiales bacterium]